MFVHEHFTQTLPYMGLHQTDLHSRSYLTTLHRVHSLASITWSFFTSSTRQSTPKHAFLLGEGSYFGDVP